MLRLVGIVVFFLLPNLVSGIRTGNNCCPQCPFYQGLAFSPGCHKCQSPTFAVLGQSVAYTCSPCNSTLGKLINARRGEEYFWHPRGFITETHNTPAASTAKFRPDFLGEPTIGCFFGPERNISKAEYRAYKQLVVCRSLPEPRVECFSFLHESTNNLAIKCNWKVDEKIDFGSTKKQCRFDYSKSMMNIYEFGYERPIAMKNSHSVCGVDRACWTEDFCISSDQRICKNPLIEYHSNMTLVILAKSKAEQSREFQFKFLEPQKIYKQYNQPFVISNNTTSCTTGVNVNLPIIGFKNAMFTALVQVIDSISKRVMIVSDQPVMARVSRRSPPGNGSLVIFVIDRLLPNRFYDIAFVYRLNSSIYSSNEYSLKCGTLPSAPTIRPFISPGAFMKLGNQLIVYTENVSEEYQFGRNFNFVAILDDEKTVVTVSQPGPVLSLPLPALFNGTLQLTLKCRNELGWCDQSTELIIDAEAWDKRTNTPIAIRQESSNLYHIGWSQVAGADSYVLLWCRGSAPVCSNTPLWMRLDNKTSLHVMRKNESQDSIFFVSACAGNQCGPMVLAHSDYKYRLPQRLSVNRPVWDSHKRALILSWSPVAMIQYVGSYYFDYLTNGSDGLRNGFTNETEIYIPCDEIESGRITSVNVRLIVKMWTGESRNGTLDSDIAADIYISEWTSFGALKCVYIPSDIQKVIAPIVVVLLIATLSLFTLAGVLYWRFTIMSRHFLKHMTESLDQMQYLYEETKAAKEEKLSFAKQWYTETFGALPAYDQVDNIHCNVQSISNVQPRPSPSPFTSGLPQAEHQPISDKEAELIQLAPPLYNRYAKRFSGNSAGPPSLCEGGVASPEDAPSAESSGPVAEMENFKLIESEDTVDNSAYKKASFYSPNDT